MPKPTCRPRADAPPTPSDRSAAPPIPGDARLAAVCSRLGVRLLVLFGSRAPGGLPLRADSDVDLAYLTADSPSGAQPVSRLRLEEELAAAFPGLTLDVVPLRSADPLFRWEVMRKGVLLAGDADCFWEYRAYAFRDYTDSADLRALERTLAEKKLRRLEGLVGGTAAAAPAGDAHP